MILLYDKFKTCKPFNPSDHIKPHTPHLTAADSETISKVSIVNQLPPFYNNRKIVEST